MTNKLVVIINSLKVTKIKKILLYEMKFLVPNYSCLRNPWIGGYCPQIPVLSVLSWICWTPPPHPPPPKNSLVRHCPNVWRWCQILLGVLGSNSEGIARFRSRSGSACEEVTFGERWFLSYDHSWHTFHYPFESLSRFLITLIYFHLFVIPVPY